MRISPKKGYYLNSKHNRYNINSDPDTDTGGFYFLSNDWIRFKRSKIRKDDQIVVMGIANPHFLHVIHRYGKANRLIRIIGIDHNGNQIRHLRNLIGLISESPDRQSFFESLFCVELSNEAKIILLSEHPLGNSVCGLLPFDKKNVLDTERKIWSGAKFDSEKFKKRYGLSAKLTDRGLVVDAPVIGGFNRYYATAVCTSEKDYDLKAFCLSYFSGYLSNEQSFAELKAILKETEIVLINDGIESVCEEMLLSVRYHPVIFWASNLFIDYFIDRNQSLKDILAKIKQLGTNQEPELPECEINLVQDHREFVGIPREIDAYGRWGFGRTERKLSVHAKNFRILSENVIGTNSLEIVNMPGWIEKDKGLSKLLNVDYALADDFLKNSQDCVYDSIIVHILLGHGYPVDKYRMLLEKAARVGRRVLVLEHNRESRDFRSACTGAIPEDIRDILGKENSLLFCPGKKVKDRNFLMIYDVQDVR